MTYRREHTVCLYKVGLSKGSPEFLSKRDVATSEGSDLASNKLVLCSKSMMYLP